MFRIFCLNEVAVREVVASLTAALVPYIITVVFAPHSRLCSTFFTLFLRHVKLSQAKWSSDKHRQLSSSVCDIKLTGMGGGGVNRIKTWGNVLQKTSWWFGFEGFSDGNKTSWGGGVWELLGGGHDYREQKSYSS